MSNEVLWYATICQTDYPDAYKTSHDLYGDTLRAAQSAAECAYWYLNGELPAWGTVLQEVIVEADGNIFVHCDPDRLQ